MAFVKIEQNDNLIKKFNLLKFDKKYNSDKLSS